MIQARGIQKHFGPLQVLKGIDLDIVPGHVTAIVGPSGAGKTTLLQILGTLSVPDSGTVTYDSDNPFTLSDRRLSEFRNRRIGFVFQQHRLLPEFNLLENVAMPALISGNSRREAFEKARTLIKRLGLGHRLEHRPAELSGGECQRASVARALINSPQVILADEPSGSRDSQNKNELHRLFFELRDEIGATFVIVTHDETLASDCNHVIHMLDGRIDRVSHNS
ncbi:MAG: ABC transporter ATP-binding protein [Muribaculaceae bacterium]|nr:ABC transporter ATP-binding protein [Muribaculaceae bacterium]